jgi:hypothetical protein
MDPHRRTTLAMFVAALAAPRAARSQMPPRPELCPANTVPRVRIRTEIAYQEREMSLFGQTTKQKIPVAVMLWDITCEPTSTPLPPTPPPRPNPKTGLLDTVDTFLETQFLMQHTTADYRIDFLMPSFVAIEATSPSLDLVLRLADGRTAASAWTLARDATSFRVQQPTQVDHWLSTAGSTAVGGQFSVSGVHARSTGVGSGTYSVRESIGDFTMRQTSGGIASFSTRGGGGTFDPQGQR